MVTGSHIPADRNGIKFYRPDGEIDKADEAAITAIAAEIEAAEKSGTALDIGPGTAPDLASHVMSAFSARNAELLPALALEGLKVGVYQHSTVARDLLVETLRFYGAEVLELGRSETFIPVDTEAVSADTVRALKGWSKEHGLDAIVSADGDGDRPSCPTKRGSRCAVIFSASSQPSS